MSLVTKLKDAKEAHAAAKDFLELLNVSVARFELLTATLDEGIARQETFLRARNMPEEGDFPLASLRKRRSNLAHSLETLRVRVPGAQTAFKESAEGLLGLANAIDRALDGQKVTAPDAVPR